ncbi:hypothetical protein HXA31_03055 [Salipaludibacillus agaradhaerens]|jgi:hypothetical protein|uniref:Uncharacterized protein n=1 Tax=Salipaludibacillus agaradhaerens TaxID=76935 RepID=A0A9Q4B2I7_SALAG|nr:hypothetical protein [Salipaludibacillus agaradhaerens]MCR6097183.1 hypothetical protein [Salipaludibacillus agaradhaerens]MCR6113332.1 hypothetical protein [Salipaludibacillus agaradhaerens]
MRKKIKVVNKFILGTVITCLPFSVFYLLLGNWLSEHLNKGKTYVDDPYLFTDNFIFYRNIGSTGVITGQHILSTDTPHYWHEGGHSLLLDSFQISTFEIFWIGLLVSIFLIVIGRLLALGMMKIIAKQKIKWETDYTNYQQLKGGIHGVGYKEQHFKYDIKKR